MFDLEYFNNFVYLNKSNRLKEKFIQNNFPDFYEFIQESYEGDSFLEKLYIFANKKHFCYCGNKTKFISFKKGYLEFCSILCSSNNQKTRDKYKKTCLSKYGVDNVSSFDYVKKKKEKTFIEKYGVSTYLQTDSSKSKIISKYGVDNPFKSKEVQNLIKKTNLEKYGNECSLLSKEVREKSIKTIISRYGVDHFSKTDIWKNKTKNSNNYNYIKSLKLPDTYTFLYKDGNNNFIRHLECNSEFSIQTQLLRLRMKKNVEICRNCNKIEFYSENNLLDYISSIYKGQIFKWKDKKYEIDIFLPELKLGFEFNGLYWHSELFKDKNYHLDKTKYFKEMGIRIINIWEDDWLYKGDIVKSIIKSNISCSDMSKIHARKCNISEISDKECKKFLNENHIQGWCVSKYRYALFYNNEIISVLTIGKVRKNLGYNSDKLEYEILRFCNKINTKVVGGFSKLLTNVLKKLKFDRIITYSDFSMFSGDIYVKNGFKFIKNTDVGYHYIVNGIRKNRFNFNKTKLIKMGFDKSKTEHEIMFDNKCYRIHDCGNLKFELINHHIS